MADNLKSPKGKPRGRKGGRKPAPPQIYRNNLLVNVRALSPQQQTKLIEIVIEFIKEQEQTK